MRLWKLTTEPVLCFNERSERFPELLLQDLYTQSRFSLLHAPQIGLVSSHFFFLLLQLKQPVVDMNVFLLKNLSLILSVFLELIPEGTIFAVGNLEESPAPCTTKDSIPVVLNAVNSRSSEDSKFTVLAGFVKFVFKLESNE